MKDLAETIADKIEPRDTRTTDKIVIELLLAGHRPATIAEHYDLIKTTLDNPPRNL